MSGWVAVMCRPNCENIAVANLRQQGYQTYYPRLREILPDKTFRIRPLFPRYVFTYIKDKWYSLRSTYGVSYVLMGDNGPAILPQQVIDELVRREQDGFIILSKQQPFKLGAQVRAVEGPLTGRVLIYDGMTSHARVKVLISLLGRECPAVVDQKSLVAA